MIFMFIFGIFTRVLSSYFVNELRDDLIADSSSLGNAYIDTLLDYVDNDGRNDFMSMFYFFKTELGIRTVILDNDGSILLDSEVENSKDLKAIMKNTMIQTALGGEISINTGSTKSGHNNLTVSVAVPMIRSGITYGVVFMHTAYPQINKSMVYIYKITFVTLITILGLAILFTYIYSTQTKRSLDAMIKTSKEVANGNFSSRIEQPYTHEFSELARNMNAMAEDLGKLEETRKDFFANISHDFRAPLTSIKGFVQAILDGTIPYENQYKYLNIVLDEAERLTRLTNNILLLTKMENHQVTLEPVVFDIHSMLQKVLVQFEQQILEKQLEIKLIMDKNELFVFADRNQIHRVIFNLIDNAVKFCQINDTITIDTLCVKDKVQISISDTGQGIPEEHIHLIWNRFHKVDRSRGQDKKGTGIGLSIVREIIKAHDETIDVQSQNEKGTTFIFTLPLSCRNKI